MSYNSSEEQEIYEMILELIEKINKSEINSKENKKLFEVLVDYTKKIGGDDA